MMTRIQNAHLRYRHIGFSLNADTTKFTASIAVAQRAVFGMRVVFMVGYNPQRLLEDRRER